MITVCYGICLNHIRKCTVWEEGRIVCCNLEESVVTFGPSVTNYFS